MDRRAAFFLGAAVISAVLVPVTEQQQRWVPAALAIVYVLLAIASWADKRTRTRGRPHQAVPSGPGFDTGNGVGRASDAAARAQRARRQPFDPDER